MESSDMSWGSCHFWGTFLFYARLSVESVQVKLSAIEIKVQFTLLLENFEQDIRLLMNDFSNLLRAKESMAQNYSDKNKVENLNINH